MPRRLLHHIAPTRAMPVAMPALSHRLHVLCLAVLLIACAQYAFAQSESKPESNDAPSTEPTQQSANFIGETTTRLLAAQADGSIAGPGLPMLGAAGNLSWHRYLDSFKYKIPESFNSKIDEAATGR